MCLRTKVTMQLALMKRCLTLFSRSYSTCPSKPTRRVYVILNGSQPAGLTSAVTSDSVGFMRGLQRPEQIPNGYFPYFPYFLSHQYLDQSWRITKRLSTQRQAVMFAPPTFPPHLMTLFPIGFCCKTKTK